MHHRRIVCDIDDTISFTSDRNWENSSPNIEVIKKINYLYDIGWEIYLVTARGQVSCGGDFIKADKKYRKVIESWLNKHGVKYHILSFQKFLGAYYIDDKALSPKDFVDLEIIKINTGKSGAEIEKRNNKIYKTFKDREKALNEATWYNLAKHFICVPKIHSVVDKTLCIEYIKNNGNSINYNFIIDTLDRFKNINDIYKLDFNSYIENIEKDHKETILELNIEQFKLEKTNQFDDEKSFCHGDFTIENVIISDNGNFLIDPIYKNQYSSWLLDASKILLSIKKNNYSNLLYESIQNWAVKNSIHISLRDILYLEYIHWIRIYKYALEDEKDFIKTEIQKLYRKIYD